jgi:glycosyltransferase involved in cell wall biosynthesis
VLNQVHEDIELIVVADGCMDTVSRLTGIKDPRFSLYHIDKVDGWGAGVARNVGLFNAKGKYSLYLDTDDFYGPVHISMIDEQIGDADWVWYADWKHRYNGWDEDTTCNVKVLGRCGTSNVCHLTNLNVRWGVGGYGYDDWGFIQALMAASKNYKHIETPQYYVCHVPRKYDV